MAAWRLDSSTARAAGYGAIHALVDASCVFSVWRTGSSSQVEFFTSFAIVFGYDLLAFAGQFPLGALADRLKASRASAYLGLALTTLALLLIRHSPIATMLCAGIGNALFHLGAGASVLRSSEGRAAPAGLFVAPGALGLGLGTWMGKSGAGEAWPLVALLLLALPLIDVLHGNEQDSRRTPTALDLGSGVKAAALALLLLSIAIRSFVGFGACHECAKSTLLLIGIPLAAFAGKSLGGIVSDRLGWIETSVGALLLSAPFIAFNGGNPYVAIPGLLLFQMTMPVTLVAVWRLMPDRPATAFGLPCLALVAGAAPTFYPEGRQLFGSTVFVSLIVTSAVAVFLALRALGLRPEPLPPVADLRPNG